MFKRLWYQFILFTGEKLFRIGLKFKLKVINAFPDELGEYHPDAKPLFVFTYTDPNTKELQELTDFYTVQLSVTKKLPKDQGFCGEIIFIYETPDLGSPEFIKYTNSAKLNGTLKSITPNGIDKYIGLYDMKLKETELHIKDGIFLWQSTITCKFNEIVL